MEELRFNSKRGDRVAKARNDKFKSAKAEALRANFERLYPQWSLYFDRAKAFSIYSTHTN